MKHLFSRDRIEGCGSKHGGWEKSQLLQGIGLSVRDETVGHDSDKGNVQIPKSSVLKPCELLMMSAVTGN